jgi:hypothetical protein
MFSAIRLLMACRVALKKAQDAQWQCCTETGLQLNCKRNTIHNSASLPPPSTPLPPTH